MRNTIGIIGALPFVLAASAGLAGASPNREFEAKADAAKRTAIEPARVQPTPVTVPAGGMIKRLFLDVHELGKGKVTARAVADAHRRDLATEGKYGVDYKAYWVDERDGKVYCLAEAPSADAAKAVHKEAHGLLPVKIMEVSADNADWVPTPGVKLFMDVHHLGPGKVTPKDVAAAHRLDQAVEARHNVRYLNYWVDPASGTIMCLVEAPNAEAAIAVHREAHGLIPESIAEVSEGR
jgi:hypothetical protein